MIGIYYQDVEVNIIIEEVIKWQDFQKYESCYRFLFINCKKLNVRNKLELN